MSRPATAYRLERTPPHQAPPPHLDAAARAVVEHAGGPLLVLAGPGTGKTTTLVEAVAARVARGTPLDRILVLTFSRKAAAELRERITARLGVTTESPAAWTFHAFCYALVRAWSPPDAFGEPLRLLSGPEQDVAIRELLMGAVADGTSAWPPTLAPALPTRGFAEEVRALLARVRELGLDPGDLAALGARAGRPAWAAAAAFCEGYLDVLDAQGAIDYAELVHRAVVLAGRADVRGQLRERYAAVLVDEYQDTDPGQEALLRALAGDGRDLVVVGDPDQSIYAFRGADIGGILHFRDRFPTADGAPAPVVTLQRSRRAGRRLLAASRAVAGRIALPGLPAEVVRRHRALEPAAGVPDGRVDVRVLPTTGAEQAYVADLLRRAHLEDGIGWDRMAVLVRSGTHAIPSLRRVLSAAGVPVEVAGDELPLAREAAVAPLLAALRVADRPEELTVERARDLLLSPLGGADASDLRRLGRALRDVARAAARADGGGAAPPRPSAVLLREALADPRLLTLVDERVARPAHRLAGLVQAARAVLAAGGPPEEALWAVWAGSDWPRRLERASFAGGATGRAADRDLDAVLALFETLGRAEQRRGHRGVANLLAELEAQQIPGDTLAERGTRGAAVRLLTAHRSKGLEWDLVVVSGVQEGRWPDLRRRGSLLEADRLGPEGLREPPQALALLAEERRLFYVACTRARRRLVVTAVAGADDDGERPSRFLDELGVTVVPVPGRPRRPLSLAGLVAELRRTVTDPAATPALRRAAGLRLASLAAARRPDGRPLTPWAHPDAWWGLAEVTERAAPVVQGDRPLRLSGTSLSGLDVCPLRWFFQHEARAATPTSAAMGFGGLLHQLADDVAGERSPADPDALMARLDRVWSQLAFDAPWESIQQRAEARRALERFCRWHASERGRRLVATEVPFRTEIAVGDRAVTLTGRMDRVELDAGGRVHVVDFKTGKSAPSKAELARHPQLGIYQLAVREGALGDVEGMPPGPHRPGGAELVQLRKPGPDGGPKVQAQPALGSADPVDPADPAGPVAVPDGAAAADAAHPVAAAGGAGGAGSGEGGEGGGATWVERLLAEAVARLVAEDFPATPGHACNHCDYARCCPSRPAGRRVVE
ncbi:MAG: ATP-dependent helicase [Frankiaceae bacterium]